MISDLGGPTANMYMLRCKSPRAEQTCRRLSCVYPDICPHMDTNHEPTINLYRRARELKGIKKILIASGVRYDIAVEDPRYIKELATHHVGGYLKIAPEHTEEGPLSKMMKPGMGSYDRFKELFDTYSKQAGKEQYLIPYFISAHPGTRDEDMVNLALWLKKHRFRLDQVQNFYPSPLANSTTMYYTGKNPLGKIGYKSEEVVVPKGDKQRPSAQSAAPLPRSGKLAADPSGAGGDGQEAPDWLPPRLPGASANPWTKCVKRVARTAILVRR
ncbi:radical SAM domain-containing protein [Klebsiella pneumoniae subsp. ozaenae]|uniref:Radical SAM domain-containing protein n=1 Tax=Klebsiella pneumoniae subsp. ozaenae TaxID=574 RepID=A0A377Z2X5_KLEPO|nr:radical SAM domain-containing protein [Klebsiella pneumoniae subsp. ozaenae]